ncbi:MAG: efflux RND transporter periplasmic adaptor subunit [Candidatus Cloacimonetes bacterium]|nr:efflux RND transporter periplasmic adaptor subunit [Candidatus Cloacimonadota bacterium]
MKRFLFSLVILSVLFISCSKKEKMTGKNIEEIYSNDGIPVRVEAIKPESFSQVMSFNAMITAKEQTSASSMIAAEVSAVKAKVGDYVEKDFVVVEFPEDTPSIQYLQAKSAYLNSKNIYNRMQNLYEKGGISLQELENTKTMYEVDEANLTALSKMLKVRAPISGIITQLTVKESDNTESGQILFTVANASELKTTIWASEKEIVHLKKDMTATASWNNYTFNGKITQVSLTMNRDKQAFAVDLVFKNSHKMNINGVTALIKITNYHNENAVVVDRKNSREDSSGRYVYIAKGDKAEKRYVDILRESGIKLEIGDGISAGENLIVEGINLLGNNKKIKIIK